MLWCSVYYTRCSVYSACSVYYYVLLAIDMSMEWPITVLFLLHQGCCHYVWFRYVFRKVNLHCIYPYPVNRPDSSIVSESPDLDVIVYMYIVQLCVCVCECVWVVVAIVTGVQLVLPRVSVVVVVIDCRETNLIIVSRLAAYMYKCMLVVHILCLWHPSCCVVKLNYSIFWRHTVKCFAKATVFGTTCIFCSHY